ncbi:alpha/beta hydrolase family protein [Tenacibaculum amylolyticum]|uniref:alpha/beta hydrolase family protein n=1 Tax=Tenacibaculum amylolyticum TaxID=104269 RepID=UPI0038959FA6
MKISIENIKIPARDGYMLSGKLFQPNGISKGLVQIHGGTGIPQKLYSNFATYIAKNDFTALTFDYRGIAASAPRKLKGFEATVSDWAQLDMSGVLDWTKEHFPNQKKIIAAHSIGGQMIGLMDNYKDIDQLFLITSSTGYWKDMSNPHKWFLAFFWYFLIPIHIKLFGYANAMKIRQGENLPKGVILQLKKWCTHPSYFELDFDKDLSPNFYDKIRIPIKAIQVQDDPLANHITSNKFLKYFSNTTVEVEKICPKDYGNTKIGHTGFFSRKFEHNLWKKFVKELKTS